MSVHFVLRDYIEHDLKELRESLGLTVEQAATRCNVKRRTWQRWEKLGRIPQDALARFKQNGGDHG